VLTTRTWYLRTVVCKRNQYLSTVLVKHPEHTSSCTHYSLLTTSMLSMSRWKCVPMQLHASPGCLHLHWCKLVCFAWMYALKCENLGILSLNMYLTTSMMQASWTLSAPPALACCAVHAVLAQLVHCAITFNVLAHVLAQCTC
jgi:hypothetical protein